MHLPILLFLFLGIVVSGEARESAMGIVGYQVAKFVDAMHLKKKDVILQLFNTTADDQKNVDEFMEKFQGIGFTILSAKFINNGKIESNVLVTGNIPGKIFMTKSPGSLTGWKITQLGVEKPKSVGKNKFSMCYVGLFWCAVEVLAEWGDRQ